MINNKKIKVGVVGCGKISSQHFAALDALKEKFLLKAVCDINGEKFPEFLKKYPDARCFSDLDEFLKQDLYLVVIASPNNLNVPMGIKAAMSGKNALIEKPVAFNIKDFNKITKIFKDNKKEIFPVMQVRYNQALRWLKQAISDGKIGEIYSVNLNICWCRPQSYFDEAPWRGKKENSGGSLLNQAIHYIDAMQWIAGSGAESVYGKIDTLSHNIEVEDIARAIIIFKNKVSGIIDFNLLAYPKNLECSLTLIAKNGAIKIGGKAINKIEFCTIGGLKIPEISENVPLGFSGSSPNHIFLYEDIANHFNNNSPVLVDINEAGKSIEIIEAIYKSAKENKEIKLPL